MVCWHVARAEGIMTVPENKCSDVTCAHPKMALSSRAWGLWRVTWTLASRVVVFRFTLSFRGGKERRRPGRDPQATETGADRVLAGQPPGGHPGPGSMLMAPVEKDVSPSHGVN